MSDKYQPLRDACVQLNAEASAQGGRNERSQLILDLLSDFDAASARVNELSLVVEHQAGDVELLGLINTRRIGIEHEYEGPTIASVWGDEPEAIASAEGATVQEAIRAAVVLADAKEAAQAEAPLGGVQ
jgi:hypothetical protein